MSTIDDSCCISLFDFIPEAEQAAIVARTSTTDTTGYFQAAIDHVDARGGGCICVPAGTYQVNGTIELCKNLILKGAGQRGSILRHTGTGHCLLSEWPIDASTAVHISVRSLGLVNTAGANNTGSGIYERGGTYVLFHDLLIENFRYGITFNQTELGEIDLCTIQHQRLACIWLQNGDDSPPTSTGFTNRISVTRCQINGATDGVGEGYGILDDGGVCHAFRDNNYNGCWTQIRAAGVTNLIVSGGEFEGAGTVIVHLTNVRRSGDGGGGVGYCGAVLLENCGFFPGVGRSSVQIDSCDHLTLLANGFGNTGASTASIVGMNNANKVTEAGTSIDSLGPLFDSPGLATTRLYSTTAALFGTATYDPPSLALGASGPVQTMTVNGVQPGDPVEDVSFSQNSAGVVFHAWVSAANTVSYFAQNVAGANPTDLPSGTLRVKVRRRVF